MPSWLASVVRDRDEVDVAPSSKRRETAHALEHQGDLVAAERLSLRDYLETRSRESLHELRRINAKLGWSFALSNLSGATPY